MSYKDLFDLKEIYRDALYDMLDMKQTAWKSRGYKIYPFVAQVGSNWERADKKILFIGKATNGWVSEVPHVPEHQKEEIDKYIERTFSRDEKSANRLACRDDAVFWVERDWDKPILGNNRRPKDIPFWQVVKETTMAVEGKTIDWSTYIAWSELYKFAPKEKNPTERQKKIQAKYCWEILDKELFEIIKPKVAIFFCSTPSDGDWAKEYLEDHLKTKEQEYRVGPLLLDLRFMVWNGITIIRARHPQAGYGDQKAKASAIKYVIKEAQNQNSRSPSVEQPGSLC